MTAHVGGRTAVVSPDLTISPGGVALCGSDFYYGGPNLSLRVVFGHTMTLLNEVLLVGALGAVLLSAAVLAFNRQE